MEYRGIVIKSTGSNYTVEDLDTGVEINCRIKGRFRLKGIKTTNPISVGDRVRYIKEDDTVGVISTIEPRTNYIIRRSTNLSHQAHIIAANVDRAFLVVTLDFPYTPSEFMDRFLLTCELYKIPATIILNKIDLFQGEEIEALIDDFEATYKAAGYDMVRLSALHGSGVEKVKEMTSGITSLFAGNSGVGKSTLIKQLAPEYEIRTGEISDHHKKGKHTTTFSHMYKIGKDSYLVDTPGIKGFGLIDVEPEEMARYMPDIFGFAPDCRFSNCTHRHEPGCAVKVAAEDGKLSEDRYNSYLKLLEGDDKYR